MTFKKRIVIKNPRYVCVVLYIHPDFFNEEILLARFVIRDFSFFDLSPHQVSFGERSLGDRSIELDVLDFHLGLRIFPQLVLHGYPGRVVSVPE